MLDRSQSYLLVVLGSDRGARFDHIGSSGRNESTRQTKILHSAQKIYIPSSPRVTKAALHCSEKTKRKVTGGMKYKIVNSDFLLNTHKVNVINNVRIQKLCLETLVYRALPVLKNQISTKD